MGYYHLIFIVICFFAEEVTKKPINVMFPLDFFVDDNDLGARIDREFIVTYKSICHLPISTLMDQVKTNYII